MRTMSRWSGAIVACVVAVALCWEIVSQIEATTGQKRVKTQSIKGSVTDSHGRPLVGATVYFIDSTTINTTPITPRDILDGTAEDRDEPLEDLIRVDVAKAKKDQVIPKAVTDKKGNFKMKKLASNGTYFAHAVPSDKDPDHLPGGDASRIAFTPKALPKKTGLHIQVSWKFPSDATYIGSSACYVCHGEGGAATDVTTNKHHGHALMFHKPGQDTANQDSAGHVGSDWNSFANPTRFVLATDWNAPVNAGDKITELVVTDADPTAGTIASANWRIYENPSNHLGTRIDPKTGTYYKPTLFVYLWRDAANTYHVTLKNNLKTEPVLTLNAGATMGGYIMQRLLVNTPGGKGLTTCLQFQALTGSASQGSVNNYDVSRGLYSTSGLTSFFDTKNKVLIPAPDVTKISTINDCAVCHLAAGAFQRFTDSSGEKLSHTVADSNGAFDVDGDGNSDEVGIGCEQCHGPGSRHREENLKTITAPATTTSKNSKTPPVDTTGEFIVNPSLLGADRASLICGRCHKGHVDEAIPNGFPPVGISRAEYLASYASASPPKGFALSSYWPDGVHIKGGHEGTSYPDYLASKHMRNSRQLVACSDCHDAMGDSSYRYFLKGDPDDPQAGLCIQCHAVDITKHVPEKTGAQMMGAGMKCINCHMPRMGKRGAGRPGLLLGTPTGLTTDANIVYWENDQGSHIYKPVAHKFSAGVAGVLPSSAMPTPYTNSCGTCHDATMLQYQAPQ